MQEIDLDGWVEFAPKIQALITQYCSAVSFGSKFSTLPLFRGQSNAKWPLDTTLERYSKRTWTVSQYMERILACADQFESLSNRTWNIPDWPKIKEELTKNFEIFIPRLPHYSYWVHLRHHGFPSPLLDWTKSPFIAAYFAYANSCSTPDQRVAVFMFVETPQGFKTSIGGAPRIDRQGPYVRTHKRHFLQQSWYTIATTAQNDDHTFVSHSNVVTPADGGQDLIIKITLPSSDRVAALGYLHGYNINDYSLFQTEDALAKTLAFLEIGSTE